jgi:hypothetical protein
MKYLTSVFTIALLVSQVAVAQTVQPKPIPTVNKEIPSGEQGDKIPGEIIVMFHNSEDIANFERRYMSVNGHRPDLHVIKQLSVLSHIYLFSFSEARADSGDLLKVMSQDPSVRAVQFNHFVADRSTPNDPSFSQQWHHMQSADHDIDSDLAWDITTGGFTANGDPIVVAVLEGGGANWNHTDLIDNHWVNSGEIPGNNIDDDGNGYIDDVNGWNTTSNSDIISAGGHGTSVSGMIGAQGDNNLGGVGVNWNVGIMQVQMGGLTESNVIAAYSYPHVMRYMYNSSGGSEGAFVVATNASWGIDLADPANYPVWCAYYNDLGASGILNCGATANAQYNIDTQGDMPTGCSSDYMISVTATNSSDVRTFSAYGATTIDLAAPGENVYLPSSSSSYSSTSGTSFASPCVAGAIALVYSAPCTDLSLNAITSPQATADLVRGYILDGVDQVAQLANETVTGGRLNVFNSLTLALNNCNSDIGCMDSSACNYIPEAIEDSGNCLYYDDCMECGGDNSACTGCTDAEACNFDASYTIDDGSCVYGNGISLTVGGGSYDNEISWSLLLDGVSVASGTAGTADLCVGEGCYTFSMSDSFGDGWNGAVYVFNDLSNGSIIASGDLDGAIEGDATSVGIDSNLSVGIDYISVGGVSCGVGCMDDIACNYDSEATVDDGSCLYDCIGCTDPLACNYDPTATVDDGSCVIGGVGVSISILTDNYPEEITWQLLDAGGNVIASAGPFLDTMTLVEEVICVPEACYSFVILDSFGDGICCAYGDGSYEVTSSGVVLASGGSYADSELTMFCVGGGVMGCTNSAACNYNSEADLDDGSCDYECVGCTDEAACNYDETATIDNGDCVYPDPAMGCDCESTVEISSGLIGGEYSDPITLEGNGTLVSVEIEMSWMDVSGSASWAADLLVQITSPDGSCFVFGGYDLVNDACTNLGDYMVSYPDTWTTIEAGIFSAIVDVSSAGAEGEGAWEIVIANGYSLSEGASFEIQMTLVGICTSEIADVLGCTDPSACNFNFQATSNDGSCEYSSCSGCMDESSCNFDTSSTIDDGSCEYDSCLGCTLIDACNYTPLALIDDGSCLELDECEECGGDNSTCSGCTDPEACNFSEVALVEDDTCEYDSCDCPADLNDDGVISVADILLLLGQFGCAEDCTIDVNDDGSTNVQDILILLASFGTEC